MQAYLHKLRAIAAEQANRQKQAETKRPHNTDPRVLCDKPLTQQIEELMRTLSPAQRDRPWTMEELCLRVQGRYSARPHPMRVGEALRALGWTSIRDWSRDGAGRRNWLLPVHIEKRKIKLKSCPEYGR